MAVRNVMFEECQKCLKTARTFSVYIEAFFVNCFGWGKGAVQPTFGDPWALRLRAGVVAPPRGGGLAALEPPFLLALRWCFGCALCGLAALRVVRARKAAPKASQRASEPASQPASQPASEPASPPAGTQSCTQSQPESQPASQPASEPASQPASERASERVSERASGRARQAGRQKSMQAGWQALDRTIC